MVPSILFLSKVVAVVELIEVDLVNERARQSHGVEACIENRKKNYFPRSDSLDSFSNLSEA